MAQKGYFVSATVCEAGGQNKTQSAGLSSHRAGLHRELRGKLTRGLSGCDVTLLTHAALRGHIVTALNVAVDVNIAFCAAFVFLNSIQ